MSKNKKEKIIKKNIEKIKKILKQQNKNNHLDRL